MRADKLEKEMIEFYQTTGRLQGLDSSLSTIIGVLFLEPEEISMEELAKKTGYSLASICNKIKMIEPSGWIKRIRKPHTKKIYLYMEKDIMKIMKNIFLLKQESVIRLAKEKVPSILERYKNMKLSEEQKKKLRIIEDYYKQVLKFELFIREVLKKIDEFSKRNKDEIKLG